MVDHDVLIVGAGFSGIGVATKLREAGVEDLLLVEEGVGVGGTWRWNTYPGVAVDIPSFSYSYSWASKAPWSRVYAPGKELLSYAERIVDEQDLRGKVRFGTRITAAAWEAEEHRWRLSTADGEELTARWVVSATGVLNEPKQPEIAGLDSFTGTTVHTARWDHDLDLTGKRVAVIGTGASAVQLIPEIAPDVLELTVFQRTPIWCMPKPDAALPPIARAALAKVPGLQRAARVAAQTFVEITFPLAAHYADRLPVAAIGGAGGRRFLKAQVQDPETRAKLTPQYPMGCKRPSFHNSYLKTFNRANVHLQTTPIAEVTPTGVRCTDETEHAIDVLVLATGFKVFESGSTPPFPVTGVDGLDLEAYWDEHRFQAYEGTSVPGFPNLFTVLGPYAYNAASYFTLVENQARHITRCIAGAVERGATQVEVSQEANDRFFAEMLSKRHRQVFFQEDCSASNSYYFTKHGDVPLRPTSTLEAAWRSHRFPLSDYRFTTLDRQPAVAA